MALKQNNEITVKLNTTKQELIELLTSKGFTLKNKQFLEDLYFIPNNLNIKNLSVREIISHAVLLRSLFEIDKVTYKGIRLCYKQKVFDNNDCVTKQTQYNVDVISREDAKNFLQAIGYTQILEICEYEYQLIKNELMFEIKDVENGDILMEIETVESKNFDTVDKIIQYLKQLKLPVDETNYFVKKAEIELQKRLTTNKQ